MTLELVRKRHVRVLSYGKKYHASFLYHESSKDLDIVTWLVETIEHHGFICYYRARDTLPWEQTIKSTLQSLRCSVKIIILLSEEFNKCRFCQNDLAYAIHENLSRGDADNPDALVPLRLEGCPIPLELGPIKCLEVSEVKTNWVNILMRSLEVESATVVQDTRVDNASRETPLTTATANAIENAAIQLSKELRKANQKDLYDFLSKPIALDLSHLLYQSNEVRGFHLAMNTLGITVEGDTVSITMDVFKEYAPRPYQIADIFNEHIPKISGKVNKIKLVISGASTLLSRDFESDVKEFNKIVRRTMKAKSDHYLTGILYDVEGIPKTRDLRDKCRFLIHDAIVEEIEDNVTHPQYSTYEARMMTYTRWPTNIRPTAEMLAEAGYFLDNNGVVLRCFYCNGVDWDFKPHEDPWRRHAKWYYNCPFVIANKGRTFIQNSRFGKSTPREIYNPLYENFRARFLSFQTWPHEDRPHALRMTDAGLYYTRLEDKACCFYCGHGFRNWRKKDDPWFRHALLAPGCKYVLKHKSAKYLAAVRNERKKIAPTDQCTITYCIKSREAR